MSVQLSAHFLLSEMVVTSKPFPNEPNDEQIECLRQLSQQLELWRPSVGPLKVTSGFRSLEVNRAVGGSRTSQHLRGEACDVIPVKGRPQAWDRLLKLIASGLPIDQAIIYEAEPHIHVSYTRRYPPRREVLVELRDHRYVQWASYTGILRAAA